MREIKGHAPGFARLAIRARAATSARKTTQRPAMIPARYAPYLFGLILSGLMSCIVAGLSTFRTLGLVDHFALMWLGNWLVSWATSFPIVLVVAPVTRRIVARLTAQA
jgi:hypothetical protein